MCILVTKYVVSWPFKYIICLTPITYTDATNTTISAKHVYDLMSCLDEIELAHNRSELIERFAEYVQREEGNPEDEIARIRLVLVQSLAASVLS